MVGAVNQKELDKRAEIVIGILLRTGVLVSAAVVLFGGVLYLIDSGAQHPDYRAFRGEPATLRQISQIFRSALAGDPAGIIQCGLLILVATPVARVIFSVWAFLRERDWMYVSVTLLVLALLLYGLLAAHS